MNAFSLRACGRILWREAAEQYAFCIGIFALLVTLQASLVTMETFDIAPPPSVAFGFGMALFMTAIYSAASSALLLTAETDAGTFSFQRTRPIGWLTYLWGKLSWVVLSSLLLGLVGWLETAVWMGVFPSSRDASLALGVSGVGILEGLTWGLIASMLVRQPLRAVIAGIALASLGAWVSVAAHHLATGSGTVAVETAYYEAAAVRLIAAAAVLAIAVPLVRIWYRTGQPLRLPALPRVVHDAADTVAVAGQWESCDRPCRGRWIRLIWHAWRQIRTPAVVYWGLCLVACVGVGLRMLSRVTFSSTSAGEDYSSGVTLATIAVVAFSSLLAGYTFGADQRAGLLQLARDGVSPWEVWLSRLGVMAAVLLPPAAVVYVSYWAVLSAYDHLAMFKPLATLLVVLGFASVLTIGQACSMFCRSRIISVLAAPVMTGCFAFWVAIGVFFLGLGWKLGAAPMLLALLVGSRLLAGTRLRQDNSWRAMRVPALLVIVAMVFSYQALARHRTSEIRPYDSLTQTVSFASPPHTTVKNPLQSTPKWAGYTVPRQWMKETLQGDPASVPRRMRYPWLRNTSPLIGQPRDFPVRTYSSMLIADARLNGILREVTSGIGVRNEQLRVCVDFLEAWAAQRTRHAAWLAADYQRDITWLQNGPAQNRYSEYEFHTEPLPWRYRWLPFERVRALQMLDRAYRIATDRIEEYEAAVINDKLDAGRPREGFIAGSVPFGVPGQGVGFVTSRDILPYDPSRSIWYQASDRTLLDGGGPNCFRLIDSLELLRRSFPGPLYMAESQRRGTILYLALRMYYNDHDQLPESLDALVEKKYLARLPVVPVICKPFYYEPIGASEELNATIRHMMAYPSGAISPIGMDVSSLRNHDLTVPFLWYPYGPRGDMDPRAVPGLFIDLDFVK